MLYLGPQPLIKDQRSALKQGLSPVPQMATLLYHINEGDQFLEKSFPDSLEMLAPVVGIEDRSWKKIYFPSLWQNHYEHLEIKKLNLRMRKNQRQKYVFACLLMLASIVINPKLGAGTMNGITVCIERGEGKMTF